MKNLGVKNKELAERQEKLKNAIESGDSEKFVKVQVEMAKDIEARILQEAKRTVHEDINDSQVMIQTIFP